MFRDLIDGKRTDDSRIIIALEPFLLYTITLLLLYVLQFGALRTKNIVSFSETVLTAIMKSAAKILPCLIAILAPTIVSSGPSWLELRQQTSSMHLRDHHQHKIESRSISSSTWAEIEKQPYFLPTTTTMTVQEGGHAFFICKVENLYNQTVSWIRSKDSYMLYIGDVKFVDDDRFELLPGNGYSDWTLRFRLIREADAGNYECQISTSPKLSQTFTLNVVVPSVSISGDKEMHVEAGSSVVLKCSVSDYLTKPTFIFWYRDDQRLIHSENGVTIVDNVNDEKNIIDSNLAPAWHQSKELYSILTIKEASSPFSGRYSCVPDNLRPASINIHVILDENPAAMQREVASGPPCSQPSYSLTLGVLLVVRQLFDWFL